MINDIGYPTNGPKTVKPFYQSTAEDMRGTSLTHPTKHGSMAVPLRLVLHFSFFDLQ